MNKVFVLAPNEDWIVDRFVNEWSEDNSDVTVGDPYKADVIWLLADWCSDQLPRDVLLTKKVLTTVHHIVPEKFGTRERIDFQLRDIVTTAYHVYNQRVLDFIRPLTKKPIHLIPYWANQKIWRPTGTRADLRKKHGLPPDAYLIGSFQRDTEGFGIQRGVFLPKLEKGPDLLVDAIIGFNEKRSDVEVVLAGWRRQYVMKRLDEAKIKHHYFELPSQSVINELYQTLDLYPVTARTEGGPQALLECGLIGVAVVSRPVGIAEQLLPPEAISDNVVEAIPAVSNVEQWKLPAGYEPYRKLIETL